MVNLKLSAQSGILTPRSTFALSALAILIVGGSGIYAARQFQSGGNRIAETAPVSSPKITIVTALGRLEPKGEVIKLSAPTSAEGSRVEHILVEEGDRVKAGQVIAILDSENRLQAALAEAQERVRVTQANLMQVKAGAKEGEIAAQRATVARIKTETTSQITAQNAVVARIDTERQNAIAAQQATITRLESELANAQIEYQRYQTLYQEGAISASIIDSKRLTLERSQQQLKEAQANLARISLGQAQQIKEAQANLARISAGGEEQIKEAESTLDKISEVRPVDVQAAQAEVNQALAAVKTAQANLDRAYVKSPRDTQVLKIHNRPGEIIAPEGIAELGETSKMYAVAEIYESDIKEVKNGQNVQITSDSFPGKLKGTVERIGFQVKKQNVINTDPSANIDNRVVEVRIRLDPTSSQKVTGLTNLQVKVTIDI